MKPSLPAPDCDLLVGIGQIAIFHGLSIGQVKALIDDGVITTFRMPPRSTIFALKSSNDVRWKAAERAHHARNGMGDPDQSSLVARTTN